MTYLAAAGAGLLLAASLPPWGWWPLAFVGIAVLARLLGNRSPRARYLIGMVAGVAWLYPSTAWMWFLTIPGYLVAPALLAAGFGAACALTPAGRWRSLGLPAAVLVVEAVRFSFPFGGVPLASFAMGQVAGPLAAFARVAGALGLVGLTVVVGVALADAWAHRWRPAATLAAVVVVVMGVSAVAPDGHDTGSLDVALVQGGGPQGTRARNTDERLVFERHLNATALVREPVDLVVWPENVVNVEDPLASTREGRELAQLARDLAPAVLTVGVVEGAGDRFYNFQIAYDPDGRVVSRYDKVRRVPYGEYVPLRGFLEALGAPTDLVPRDAIPGDGPAVLDTDVGRLGVVISWEVFFGGRARDAIGHGGTVLLNPTNGSSYRGVIVQTQQVASSRLRAIETGRWVLQVAPTGFSAIVEPDGDVVVRSGVSERRVLQGTVATREGQTWYVRYGDRPVIAVGVLGVALAWALTIRDRRRSGALDQSTSTMIVTGPSLTSETAMRAPN